MILKCPTCHKIIEEGEEFEIGEVLYCADCDSEAEIIGLDPVRLKSIKSWDKEDDDMEEEDSY